MLDSGVVERAIRGDREAFAQLVRGYRGLVFAVCFQRTGSWEDSEELTQETLVAAHRSLPSLREPRRLAAWLRGIALNMCRMHWRRQPPRMESLDPEGPPSDESPGALRRLELQDLLHRALADVPATGREALCLHYLGGYSYAEISALCDLPEKTVKSRLYEARQQLKARLLRTVAELCQCQRDAEHTARCVLDRCGTEECGCVSRLQGE
ncbi:MAG: RNA polymerase sigma factor [Candidatus Latescibacterota bacterium]